MIEKRMMPPSQPDQASEVVLPQQGARTAASSTRLPGGRIWGAGLIALGLLLLGVGGAVVYRSSAVPEPLPSLVSEAVPASTVETGSRLLAAPVQVSSASPPVLPAISASIPSTPSPVPVAPPTRIVAPAINLDAGVVPLGWERVTRGGKMSSDWKVAEGAAGWHVNSGLPGQGENIVLSGHNNTKGEIFRDVVDLEPDDIIVLYVDDQPYTYTVETRLVLPEKGMPEQTRRENARWIGPFPDERLTLVTCWPYTSNTHRVIVIAKPR